MNSEVLLAGWLDQHRISYERSHPVNGGNVDFMIQFADRKAYLDVKEVRESEEESVEGIDAHRHLRNDIRKLRAKFKARPGHPVVLVTMNFSSNYFTGLTVARALMGDVGIDFDRRTLRATSEFYHMPRGNAALTQVHNRSISGVLVFDGPDGRHCLFLNPYADHPVPDSLFPGVEVIRLDRYARGEELTLLSNYMFWPIRKA